MAFLPLLVMRMAPVKPVLHWLVSTYSQLAPAAILEDELLEDELATDEELLTEELTLERELLDELKTDELTEDAMDEVERDEELLLDAELLPPTIP